MGAPFYDIEDDSLCYNPEILGNLVLNLNFRETRISVSCV